MAESPDGKGIVVVPTYNERENIGPLVEAIRGLGRGFHVLIVDDDSPDGTGRFADELSARYPGEVRVLHRPTKEGLGRAYVAGFTHALSWDYDLFFQMDADLSHDPRALIDLAEKARDHDVVCGSRYVGGTTRIENWPARRLWLSRFAHAYARFVSGLPLTDVLGGFKVYRRAVLEGIDLSTLVSRGYVYQMEILFRAARAGFRIAEVPILFKDRLAGETKMTPAVAWEAFWRVLQIRLRGVPKGAGRPSR